MPSIKSVFLAILLTVAVFFATSYYLGTLPQVQQTIIEKAQPLIDFGQLIYAKWITLPPIVQQIILMGIPTLFAIFFMWTKDRAMQKLRQTEQQATAQKTQLSGERDIANQQAQGLQTKLQTTENKLKLYEDFYEKSSLLDDKITSVQQNNALSIQKMDELHHSEYSHLNSQIEELRKLIEQSKRIP